MRDLAREKSGTRRSSEGGPITARDRDLREAQVSLVAALGPLVALLEVGLSTKAIERRSVAEHLGAAFAHLGRLFSMLTRERREAVIARVAPDLRHMVAHDCGDEGSPRLFGGSFLDQLKTRNETLKALREARQPPAPAGEPAAKRARTTAATGTTAR
ncbi:unnamed protein product, partial [Ixodes hexagonus]